MNVRLEYGKPIPGTCIDGSTGVVKRGEKILGDFIDLAFHNPKDLECFFATYGDGSYGGPELPEVMGTKSEIIEWFERRVTHDMVKI